MILSDRTLREQLAAGRIVIDPLDESLIQPSSVDVRISNLFRVFRNHTRGVLDVKQDLQDLTELVEIDAEDPDASFMLHPGEFVLGSTFERIAVPDDLVGRVEGKALATSTPIPTPRGWTTMGEIRTGDHVFTDSGETTRVVATTEVMLGRDCYEVVFSDGSSLIADADHRWVTRSKADRKAGRPPAVRTTMELAQHVRYAGREWNHHVHLTGSVQYPEQELAIDPYVLGIWLGDGTTTTAEITTADPQVIAELERTEPVVPTATPLRYRVGGTGSTRDPATGRYRRNDSLSSRLRNAGLLGSKHIPHAYLHSSIQQRFALLEGLMDSDGYCDTWGRCEFTTIDESLAEQVCELVASLGFRPVIAKKPAMLNGVDHGPKYDVTFTPHRPVFRLTRKADRQKAAGRFEHSRAITAVRRVPSVPVRCIEVDVPHGVFLAGRRFIPTHNSSLGRLGLLIHSTAGFIDAGFDGHITLELANVASLPITLYPGMKIGQVSFMQMTTPAENPYGKGAQGSKYQGQRGPTPSRYFENFR